MNERPDICGPCGGACCKRMPGYLHPQLETYEAWALSERSRTFYYERNRP